VGRRGSAPLTGPARARTPAPTAKRYLVAAAGLAAFFLVGFVVVEAFGVPWLSAPPALGAARPWTAVVGVGLLVVDAVLPVPASLLIPALGAAFGIGAGAALALAGRTGATLLAFALGRRLGGRVAGPVGGGAERTLRRWGAAAVVLSRPVPIVGEAVAALAGASGMPWGRVVVAALLGHLPEAVLLAWAGATAGDTATGAWLWLSLVAGAALVRVLGWAGDPAGRPVRRSAYQAWPGSSPPGRNPAPHANRDDPGRRPSAGH
jgi:uncharacterized membrane protein YdjX (TVP38/TMEM64 family)